MLRSKWMLMKKLAIQVRLSNLGGKMRWSSTFAMMKNTYSAQEVLHAFTYHISHTANVLIFELKSRVCGKICVLKDHAAVAKEFLFWQTHSILIAEERVISKPRRICDLIIVAGNLVLSLITEKWERKFWFSRKWFYAHYGAYNHFRYPFY